jgi:hypothetical protein
MSETIRQGLSLVHVPHNLYAILSHNILDVGVSAYRGSHHFDFRRREHLWSKVIHNSLKVGVSLKKILSPFKYMTSRGALCQ